MVAHVLALAAAAVRFRRRGIRRRAGTISLAVGAELRAVVAHVLALPLAAVHAATSVHAGVVLRVGAVRVLMPASRTLLARTLSGAVPRWRGRDRHEAVQPLQIVVVALGVLRLFRLGGERAGGRLDLRVDLLGRVPMHLIALLAVFAGALVVPVVADFRRALGLRGAVAARLALGSVEF